MRFSRWDVSCGGGFACTPQWWCPAMSSGSISCGGSWHSSGSRQGRSPARRRPTSRSCPGPSVLYILTNPPRSSCASKITVNVCPERSSFASKIIVQSVRMIIVRAKYHCSVCPENHRSRRRLLFSLSGRSVFASKIIIQSVRKIIVRVEYHHSVCPEYHRSRRISLFSMSGRASFLLLTLV